MKKALSLTLVIVLCLGLCACGSTENSNQTQSAASANSNPDNSSAPADSDSDNSSADITNKLSLGEKASTDRAEFTLQKCELTYYVQNSGDEDTILMPVAETGDTYAASLGDCLVALTFTLTNKDRNAISYGNIEPMPEWDPKWTVSYGGNDYTVIGFDIMEGFTYLDFRYAAILDENGKAVAINEYANYLLDAEKTVSLRTFGVIDVDPEKLTDGFDFTIGVINSADEYEYFTYNIPAQQ